MIGTTNNKKGEKIILSHQGKKYKLNPNKNDSTSNSPLTSTITTNIAKNGGTHQDIGCTKSLASNITMKQPISQQTRFI